MFILARYIIREHIGPFFFALSLIMTMLVLNFVLQAMKYIIGKGISIPVIFEFIAYNLAGIIVLVVPMSILVATIMAFGRLSSDNEITAMKAGGINFYKLIIPVVILSGIITYGLFVFNDEILPVANHHARVLKKNIQTKRPTMTIEPGVYLDGVENFTMIVENKDELGSSIYGITIFDKTQRDAARTITAEKGQIEIEEENEDMIITLENGEIHDMNPRKPDNYQRISFTKYRVTVKVENLTLKKSDESFHNEREKNISQLMEDVQRYKNERDKHLDKVVKAVEKDPEVIAQLDEKGKHYFHRFFLDYSFLDDINAVFTSLNLAEDTTENKFQTRFRDSAHTRVLTLVKHLSDSIRKPSVVLKRDMGFEDSIRRIGAGIQLPDTAATKAAFTVQQVASALNSTNNYQRLMDQLMVEVNKKYSIPVACIVFVMLGAPLGVMARKGNLGIAGGISLFFFIAYYFCLILGENFADRQLLNPFVAMWFMNILLGSVGVILIYQTASEKDFGIVAFLRTVFYKIYNAIRRTDKKELH
ncbi:LptF/LptG family permease [bacterium]|nr:LptF/LptG family permease [bacterium]